MKIKINWSLLKEDIRIENWLFSQKGKIAFITFSCLIVFTPVFWNLILPLFLIDKNPSSFWFDLLVILILIYPILYTIVKFIKKYKPSFNQYLIISITLILYWSTRLINDHIEFYSFQFYREFAYLDAFFLLPIIFISGKLISLGWLKKYIIKKDKPKNKYFEDLPLDKDVSNEKIVHEVYELISNNSFNGSFTIGIVAPWGTGKTTFINGIKQQFKSSKTPTIEINFLPFLNHKEDEIVNEFFTSFISQLSVYSGRLSRSVSDYAASITKFYKRGEMKDLLKGDSFFYEKSAVELHDEIKKQIIEIDKKIVVFVDDLDRLNSKEIIQVLKLIRNSSSFPNTYFIVALDKSYIINSLISDKNFIDGTYLDKFFQLEVYLPEISKSDLKAYINNLLSDDLSSPINSLLQDINQESPLLFQYIRNYRDCIKFGNLLILHVSLLKNIIKEIDGDDLIHILLLKAKFPEIYFDLIKNRTKYLGIKKQQYYLKKVLEKKDSHFINLDDLTGIHSVEDFSEFSIDETISANKNEYIYSKSESILIKKTLFYLFGSEEKSGNSVALVRNFDKVSFLGHSKDDLPYEILETAINKYDSDFIRIIVDSNKTDQFFNIVGHYIFSDKHQVDNLLKYLTILYHSDFSNNIDVNRITAIIELIFEQKLNYLDKNIVFTSKEKEDWINEFISKSEISYDTKIKVMLAIFFSIELKNSFDTTKVKISDHLFSIFKSKLEELSKSTWEITDYSPYHIFHRIKEIVDIEKLKIEFINLISTEKVVTFCSQVLDVNHDRYNQFKTSDFVVELFGNFKAFQTFINDHKHNKMVEIQEFIQFLNLQEYVYFNRYLKFNFLSLPIVNSKALSYNTDYDNDLADKTHQLLIEFNIPSTESIIHIEYGFEYSLSRYEKDGKKYLFVSTRHTDIETILTNIYKGYVEVYFNDIDNTLSKLNKESKEFTIVKKDGTEFIKTKYVT